MPRWKSRWDFKVKTWSWSSCFILAQGHEAEPAGSSKASLCQTVKNRKMSESCQRLLPRRRPRWHGTSACWISVMWTTTPGPQSWTSICFFEGQVVSQINSKNTCGLSYPRLHLHQWLLARLVFGSVIGSSWTLHPSRKLIQRPSKGWRSRSFRPKTICAMQIRLGDQDLSNALDRSMWQIVRTLASRQCCHDLQKGRRRMRRHPNGRRAEREQRLGSSYICGIMHALFVGRQPKRRPSSFFRRFKFHVII